MNACSTQHEQQHIDDADWLGLPCDCDNPGETLHWKDEQSRDLAECRGVCRELNCLIGSCNKNACKGLSGQNLTDCQEYIEYLYYNAMRKKAHYCPNAECPSEIPVEDLTNRDCK